MEIHCLLLDARLSQYFQQINLYLCRGLENLFDSALQPCFVGPQLGPLAGQQALEQRNELQVALGSRVVVPLSHLQISAEH